MPPEKQNPKTAKQKSSRSLAATLATAFVILSILSLLLASIFQIILNFQAQQRVVAEQQESIASDAANEVSNFIEQIFDTMEDFKEHFEKDKKETTIGWYGVLSEVKNGKFFFRKDNCPWAEALMDLPDKEIKYLICCYGDFQAAVTRSNDCFVLTMKHTVIEEDPYCDCIYHDTSVDWDLTHPPKEFWDNLEPTD